MAERLQVQLFAGMHG